MIYNNLSDNIVFRLIHMYVSAGVYIYPKLKSDCPVTIFLCIGRGTYLSAIEINCPLTSFFKLINVSKMKKVKHVY